MDKIGRYENLTKIGRGAMGVVYKGYDPFFQRDVAVKLMSGDFASEPDLLERFRREAQVAVRLRHRNIIEVYDGNVEDGRAYIAMELLSGEDLKAVISKGAPLTLERKLELMLEICAGLGHAHESDIVHRDIKPSNIQLTEKGLAKILDFGLARITDSEMTATGMVMGTPSYMSPEQVNGLKVDHRSDIFSVGAVFYELLTCEKAFAGSTLAEALMKIARADPTPVNEVDPSLPEDLAAVIQRTLLKDIEERYQSVADLAADLARVQESLAARLPALRDDARAAADRVRQVWQRHGDLLAGTSAPEEDALPAALRPDADGSLPADFLGLQHVCQAAGPEAERLERLAQEISWARSLAGAELAEMEQGDLSAARQRLESLRQRHPEHELLETVEASIRQEADRRVREAQRRKQAASLRERAEKLHADGDLEAAVDTLAEALEVVDDAGIADLHRAWTEDLEEQRAAAEAERRRQERIAKLLADAEASRDAGALEKALEIADGVLREDPDHSGARRLRTTIQEAIADAEEKARQKAELEAAAEAERQRQTRIAGHLDDATTARSEGDWHAAREAVGAALQEDPGNSLAGRMKQEIEEAVAAEERRQAAEAERRRREKQAEEERQRREAAAAEERRKKEAEEQKRREAAEARAREQEREEARRLQEEKERRRQEALERKAARERERAEAEERQRQEAAEREREAEEKRRREAAEDWERREEAVRSATSDPEATIAVSFPPRKASDLPGPKSDGVAGVDTVDPEKTVVRPPDGSPGADETVVAPAADETVVSTPPDRGPRETPGVGKRDTADRSRKTAPPATEDAAVRASSGAGAAADARRTTIIEPPADADTGAGGGLDIGELLQDRRVQGIAAALVLVVALWALWPGGGPGDVADGGAGTDGGVTAGNATGGTTGGTTGDTTGGDTTSTSGDTTGTGGDTGNTTGDTGDDPGVDGGAGADVGGTDVGPADDLPERLAAIRDFIDARRFEEAVTAAQALVGERPESSEATALLDEATRRRDALAGDIDTAREHAEAGRWADALRAAQSVLTANPGNQEAASIRDRAAGELRSLAETARQEAEAARQSADGVEASRWAPATFAEARGIEQEARDQLQSGDTVQARQTFERSRDRYADAQAEAIAAAEAASRPTTSPEYEAARQGYVQARSQADVIDTDRLAADGYSAAQERAAQAEQKAAAGDLDGAISDFEAAAGMMADAMRAARATADVTAIRDVVQRFGGAFESEDLAAVREVWPGLSDEQATQFSNYFTNAASLSVEFQPTGDPRIEGQQATVVYRRHEEFTDPGGTSRTVDANTTFTLVRQGNGWVIQGWQNEVIR